MEFLVQGDMEPPMLHPVAAIWFWRQSLEIMLQKHTHTIHT